MTKIRLAGGAVAILLILLALAAGWRLLQGDGGPAAPRSPAKATATAAVAEAHPSFLYGRVTTLAGATYEGRLRFGGEEEAFWSHYFNGVKEENPWAAHVPPERLPTEQSGIEILGFRFGRQERPITLRRPFMARFGDLARIEGSTTGVRVTLKSGTVWDLDRLDASDFDDGVRVWDARRGVVNVDTRLMRTIELLAPSRPGPPPDRLHGTVRTPQGDFTGFLQWNRYEGLGTDALDGRSAEGEVSLRFDTIRSIARHSDGSLVMLRDGREIVLSGTREVGEGNGGMYVEDLRYGRVLISWDAFERVDFSERAGSGPAYDDFPPGHPLMGGVTTRDGRRLEGRLVYDLDESETTETLDAPFENIDYTIPFGLVASIALASGEDRVSVTLHSGEELQLERAGDLGDANAGMLIFVDGGERPAHVRWDEIEQIDFDRPPAMYPPFTARVDRTLKLGPGLEKQL